MIKTIKYQVPSSGHTSLLFLINTFSVDKIQNKHYLPTTTTLFLPLLLQLLSLLHRYHLIVGFIRVPTSATPNRSSTTIYRLYQTNQQATHTPATMSSPSSSVYVHQSTYSRSSSSSRRSTDSSPRPSTTYREYDAGMLTASTSSARYNVLTKPAANHTTRVTQSGRTIIVQHNKRHYDPSSPSPSYRS
ncbi:hypothetical protein LI328DRAFT_136170 [Trichoderma asperelloides]|nr:hypothetical protein LI328DRAFT_136170 [Trichoderma asperelloides]